MIFIAGVRVRRWCAVPVILASRWNAGRFRRFVIMGIPARHGELRCCPIRILHPYQVRLPIPDGALDRSDDLGCAATAHGRDGDTINEHLGTAGEVGASNVQRDQATVAK